MLNKTNDIEEKLKYLKLDLNNVPECLLEPVDMDIKPARNYEEKKYRVYKYVPISQINILLTRANRLNSLHEKCKMAAPLYAFLVPEGEEGILRHTIFLKMIQNLNISEIDNIEKEQEMFMNDIPYKVKYKENYLWQIYYSEYSKKYYMLATIEDLDCSCLFYLIKEKIEYEKTGVDKEIFVPVSYLDYSKMYFTKSQVADVEKYIWQFTKEWPLIYEVYDKNENMSFQIVGNTEVYEKINSLYKISLENGEDATRFYTLLKALFILETEFPNRYKFEVKISENGGLEFVYNSKIVGYENLTKFIKEEFLKNKQESEELNEEIVKLETKLEELKLLSKDKEDEYRMRQKQVALYLECKKSFFGRIRYYFRGKKEDIDIKSKREVKEVKTYEKEEIDGILYSTKEYYTIEDLVDITKILDRIENQIKKTNMDIKALEETIDRLSKKIDNARRYIEEIEEHKKSIFEFWSFVNKDNVLGLSEGETENKPHKEIEKTFDYEEDIEELGVKLDKKNREKFSEDEFDNIFVTTTNVINDINMLRDEEKEDFADSIENLKQEAIKTEILFSSEEFDIFGSMSEDKTKINILGNTKHREIKKNKFRILDITKSTRNEQYIKKLKDIISGLDKTINKAEFGYKLNVFYASTENLNSKDYNILNINPKNALNKLKECEKINLYNIKLNEKTKAIPLTNIVYYDNNNKTLPIGMNVSDEILVDMGKMNLELKKQKVFRINQEIDEMRAKTKIVCVYEYEDM